MLFIFPLLKVRKTSCLHHQKVGSPCNMTVSLVSQSMSCKTRLQQDMSAMHTSPVASGNTHAKPRCLAPLQDSSNPPRRAGGEHREHQRLLLAQL